MNGELYLDYSKNIKIEYIIVGKEIKYKISCKTNMKSLEESVLNSLSDLLTLKYNEADDSFIFEINGVDFVKVSRESGEVTTINQLTSFETRLLSQGNVDNNIPFKRESVELPRTDLHTHFAGAIPVDSLIEIGLKHNIKYPIKYLRKMGINVEPYNIEGDEIYLSQLSDDDLNSLKEGLKLPNITQELFTRMEDIYTYRGPLTKNKELFVDYLWVLANDYKEMGIEYVELSFSIFTGNPDCMQMLEDTLPKIEKETGVKIRFLMGLWRHSDKEWNLDEIDRINTIAKSPYIVGIDYMGHETNSSLDFEDELVLLTRYAVLNDPYFVIRVHAGENPIFKSNVYDALKVIYDEHARLEEEMHEKLPMPQVRIGHGLYGLDITSDGKYNDLGPDAVIKLIKDMNAIVEFNMSSNLALNNIDSLTDVPIKRYIDAGVRVVLGSDGHGLYSTSSDQESVLALASGLSIEEYNKILETEKYIIKVAELRRMSHPAIKDVPALYESIRYTTSDGKPRYNEEVAEKYRRKKIEMINLLKGQLTKIGAIVDTDTIIRDIEGKTPILITGASKNNWPNISIEDQYHIMLTMQVLANTLNPQTTFIITGGTNFGAEKTMHEAVNRKNKHAREKTVLLGTLTMEAVKKGNTEVEPNTITHATILELDGNLANKWQNLPDTQLIYVIEHDGEMIAVGGGPTVNDMIQRAHNIGLKPLLMDGPYGASTTKSRSLAKHKYSFKTIEELLKRLYEKNPNYFIEGFSLDNIEQYIEEAQRMIDYDSLMDTFDESYDDEYDYVDCKEINRMLDEFSTIDEVDMIERYK